jgi:hypothetical protein
MSQTKKNILILLGISAVFTAVFSCSSFLYRINPWSDANILFTMGRGMLQGKILYADLFDHKGPLLYAIYALAGLLSSVSFFGVWILETVSMFFFLYYSEQILHLFEQRSHFLELALLAAAVCTADAFSFGGGSAEEWFLPLMQASLWICLKTITARKNFDAKTCLLLGILIGIQFMMKYSVSGFYVGMAVVIIAYQHHQDKRRTAACLFSSLAGFTLICLLTCLAFVSVGHFKEFYDTYFRFNLSSYSQLGQSPATRIWMLFKSFFWYWKNNPLLLTLSVAGFYALWKTAADKYVRMTILVSLICWYLLTFWSGRYLHYYILPVAVAAVYTALLRPACLEKSRTVLICALILCGFLLSGNLKRIGRTDTVQNQFIQEMKQYTDHPSLLVYRGYDEGFYLENRTLPSCRYFTVVNNELPDYDSVIAGCMQTHHYDFLISMNEELKVTDYILLDDAQAEYDGKIREYRLYIRKDLVAQ